MFLAKKGIALALALAVSPAEAAGTRKATADLIEWIQSTGGLYNPRQEERTAFDGRSRGVFASETIDPGEILLKVPWGSILGTKQATRSQLALQKAREIEMEADYPDERTMFAECRAVSALMEEHARGGASFFATFLRYLSLLGDGADDPDPFFPPPPPALWSEEGRALLEDINDHGTLPPQGLFVRLNHDWFGSCIEDISNSTEARIAAAVSAHGGTGNVLKEFGFVVPLLDNAHYRQRQDGSRLKSDGHINTELVVQEGEYVVLLATRTIRPGEEIYRSFGDASIGFDDDEDQEDDDGFDDEALMEFETGAIFRDYGVVNTETYPKFFHFRIITSDDVDESLGIILDKPESFGDLDGNGNGKGLSAAWVIDDGEEYDWVEIEMYMARAKNRLERIGFGSQPGNGPPANSGLSAYEWETARAYHANLLEAVSMAADKLAAMDGENAVSCPGGLPASGAACPVWDGFSDLPTLPIAFLDLEFDENNPYGPSEDSYAMCNDDYVSEWRDYTPCGDEEVLRSQYQEIRFFSHPETKDTVMKLDYTVQQVSSYRPHYHEFAVHYPARFIDTVKRVLFVGGGDSMVLHEVLKYPSLELVVGLELDQYVVRNSFRYFNTQPHFDDKRVEWWFGDGAKSLLMLPKEYFQSFDLVVVDLSETVMSFQVTDKLSIFQTLSLLLTPEGIMLKNGEYYMGKMSQYFDYTLQYFEYDVPFICDQGMVIGSNSIDFFNRTMKDHGVELLVYESQDEINEKFNEYYRFTEYRKNDARKQGKCVDTDNESDDRGSTNAGILMVVEAENLTYKFQSIDFTKELLMKTLTTIGFSTLPSDAHDSSNIVVVMNEGYVSARIFPEQSYVAFDIQLWGNFHLMEKARDGLVEAFGGAEDSTSSFRIVTGGMQGTPSQESDRQTIGPRMVNSRNCEEDPPPDSATTATQSIDLVDGALEASLGLVEEGPVTVAVLCGAEGDPCKSIEVLSKASDKVRKVVPVYTCTSLEQSSAWFAPDVSQKMADCEAKIVKTLSSDSPDKRISMLVIDDSADHIMGKVLVGIFTSTWNRKRLLASSRFVAFVNNSETSHAWRRNVLVKIRKQVNYKPMSLVDLVLEDTQTSSMVSILSLRDPDFFFHQKEMVERFNTKHGDTADATMEVESVFDGLPAPQPGHFRPKKFKADDYDPEPAKEQHKEQLSLGRQSIVQFEISGNGHVVTAEILQNALQRAFGSSENAFEFSAFENNSIGDGLVVVALSQELATNVVVTWDGNLHLNVNLFARDVQPRLRQQFIEEFTTTLRMVKVTLSDTHPRGTGRVVSFPGHIN